MKFFNRFCDFNFFLNWEQIAYINELDFFSYSNCQRQLWNFELMKII